MQFCASVMYFHNTNCSRPCYLVHHINPSIQYSLPKVEIDMLYSGHHMLKMPQVYKEFNKIIYSFFFSCINSTIFSVIMPTYWISTLENLLCILIPQATKHTVNCILKVTRFKKKNHHYSNSGQNKHKKICCRDSEVIMCIKTQLIK